MKIVTVGIGLSSNSFLSIFRERCGFSKSRTSVLRVPISRVFAWVNPGSSAIVSKPAMQCAAYRDEPKKTAGLCSIAFHRQRQS
jgi:hypothetical protein